MESPLRRIYSLAKQRSGFQVWRIYAWRGFLGCPQPWPLHVIWNFTLLSTKLHLRTVVCRVFIPRHGKLKLTLRRAVRCAAACMSWRYFATKYIDRLEISFEHVNSGLFLTFPLQQHIFKHRLTFESVPSSTSMFVGCSEPQSCWYRCILALHLLHLIQNRALNFRALGDVNRNSIFPAFNILLDI